MPLIVKTILSNNGAVFLRAAILVLGLSTGQLVVNAAVAEHRPPDPGSANANGIGHEHTFRVLVQSQSHVRSLPPAERAAHYYEVSLARRFADENYLVPVFIPVERSSDLIPALLEGKGHIIAANLSVTDTRKARIAFTAPIETVREQLIVRTGDDIQSLADLAGREIVVREGSSFFNVVQEQRKRYPDIGVKLLPEQTDSKELLQGVLEGRYDMAAMDVTRFEQVAADWSHLKVVPGIFEDSAVAWGIRPDATVVLFQVEHHPGDAAGELDQLAGHDLVQAVDARDAVAHGKHVAGLGHVDVAAVVLDLALEDVGDLAGLDVHRSVPLRQVAA